MWRAEAGGADEHSLIPATKNDLLRMSVVPRPRHPGMNHSILQAGNGEQRRGTAPTHGSLGPLCGSLSLFRPPCLLTRPLLGSPRRQLVCLKPGACKATGRGWEAAPRGGGGVSFGFYLTVLVFLPRLLFKNFF